MTAPEACLLMITNISNLVHTTRFWNNLHQVRSKSIEVYKLQHYVIKLVSDLRQVGGFLRILRLSSTNKTDHHDITEVLLKVAFNTIKQKQKQTDYVGGISLRA
jgi:hypothetical protein